MDENQNIAEREDSTETKMCENESCVTNFTYMGFGVIAILTTLFFVSGALFAQPKDSLTADVNHNLWFAGFLAILLIGMLIGTAVVVVNCYSMILLKRKFGEHLNRNYFVSDHRIEPDENNEPILYGYWSQENVYIYYTLDYNLV